MIDCQAKNDNKVLSIVGCFPRGAPVYGQMGSQQFVAAAGNPVTSMVRRGFRAIGKHVRSSILGFLPPPLVTLTFTADHEMESVVGFCIDTWLFSEWARSSRIMGLKDVTTLVNIHKKCPCWSPALGTADAELKFHPQKKANVFSLNCEPVWPSGKTLGW